MDIPSHKLPWNFDHSIWALQGDQQSSFLCPCMILWNFHILSHQPTLDKQGRSYNHLMYAMNTRRKVKMLITPPIPIFRDNQTLDTFVVDRY